jgi:hypothetical protein
VSARFLILFLGLESFKARAVVAGVNAFVPIARIVNGLARASLIAPDPFNLVHPGGRSCGALEESVSIGDTEEIVKHADLDRGENLRGQGEVPVRGAHVLAAVVAEDVPRRR